MPPRPPLVLSPANGTRFKLYVQSPVLTAFREPETVRVSLPPAEIKPGPCDARIVVRRAIMKPPYPCQHPQAFVAGDGREWRGAVAAAVTAGPDGHFDHLAKDSSDFAAAAVYAIARRVTDIWEWYFGRQIDWHFQRKPPAGFQDGCLEIVPALATDTAHSGYGFLEFGSSDTQGQFNHLGPYWQNFDVIAHELGHQFIYASVGFPSGTKKNSSWTDIGTAEFRAFHESAGDLIALLSSLHFESVRKHLLNSTAGNLGSFNEVSRIGELSKSFQFRSAFNYSKAVLAADGSIARLMFASPEEQTGDGLPGRVKKINAPAAGAPRETRREFYYRASQVMTGAVFDTLVEIFQAILVARGLIPAALAQDADATWDVDPQARATERSALVRRLKRIHREFTAAFEGHEAEFDAALCAARDYAGTLLAAHWHALSPNKLTFLKAARALARAARQVERDGLPADLDPEATVARCFYWRGIAI